MHAIWIEFPAADLARAKAFYEAVFQHDPTDILSEGARSITVIPGEPTVSLNQVDGFTPTTAGSLPYFHLEESLAAVLDRVTRAGGRVLEDAHARGDNGFFAQVQDTEGNALYVHSAAG